MMVAKWLGVAPWDLAEQPGDWLAAAETVMTAEHDAAVELQKRAAHKARTTGRRA